LKWEKVAHEVASVGRKAVMCEATNVHNQRRMKINQDMAWKGAQAQPLIKKRSQGCLKRYRCLKENQQVLPEN